MWRSEIGIDGSRWLALVPHGRIFGVAAVVVIKVRPLGFGVDFPGGTEGGVAIGE